MGAFKIVRQVDAIVRATTSDLFPRALTNKLVAGTGISKVVLNPGADEQLQISTTMSPGMTVVTGSDTTPGNLNAKVSAGAGITTSVLNPGANEQLQITNSGLGKVDITSSDTTPAVLNSKLTVGAGLSKAVVNPGANETLNLVNTTSGKVQNTSSDTTPNYLSSKVLAGNNIATSTINPAGNEQLKVSVVDSAGVAISALDIDWTDPNRTFYKTLSANSTFTFSNTVEGKNIVVVLINTASNYTVTWPAGIKWANGTAPTMTIGAKADVYTFIKVNSIFYGSVAQNLS